MPWSVDKSSLHNAGYDNSFNRDIGIIIAVLESGNSVELPATGFSMFPTFRPGDKVIVKPLTKGELPKPGSVVVYIDNGVKVQTTFAKASVVKGCNSTTAQVERSEDPGRSVGVHNGVLVMHRLVKIIKDGAGNVIFITRGDSRIEPDKPFSQQHMIGVAVSYKGVKKDHSVKIFIPGALRYRYNSRLLWLYNRLLWLYNKLKA